jgi:CMP-N-acetylneuraminic acid synthetase
MAGDEASVWPAVRLSVSRWEEETKRSPEAVVLLQPTSPLRTSEDIDACLERFRRSGADACVSVSLPHDNPYFNMVEADPDDPRFVRPCSPLLQARQRRQELPPVYALNGAVYVIRRALLDGLVTPFGIKKLAVFEMPKSRSVDIDTEDDLAMAEFWMARAGGGR